MSLFDDDFYTTKVRKSTPWRSDWTTRTSRYSQQKLGVVAASAGVGIVLAVSIIWAASSGGESGGAGNAAPAVSPTLAVEDYMQLRSDKVVKAVNTVKPTVVSIISAGRETAAPAPSASPGAGSGASPSLQAPAQQKIGIGSGVIFQKNGNKAYVVTNNHVVQNATQVEVVLSNGEHKKAEIKGRDQITDLAVLEMDGDGIKVLAEFGDSAKLQSGETAIAIGNPLGLGFSQTTTVGVISSPNRRIPISFSNDGSYDWEMDVIQTDAAINQGNSGGALVNLDGQVVGINSMKVSETGVEGLGFAIPINQVKETIDSLIKYGKVKRPYLGVTTDALRAYKGTEGLKLPDTVKNGLIVMDALGPAKDAGLLANDVITELDGKAVSTNLMLRQYLYQEKKIGDTLKITYYRAGKKATATVTLTERKEE
ncbi:S1C family serine protease [Paenibacillus koleovorans]|uniref:S1C family serine protease n=1 Tax=Paenibacillus koleovorans TaxID=121608 RepID=UPI000FDA3427|nr:trypsin-like peptidase domain-containing protein [Paenibacillus koleovorans]